MCNISAYIGRPKNLETVALKCKILYMVGRERGTDSCGFVHNKVRSIGTGHTSDSVDHIFTIKLDDEQSDNQIFLMHNRNASSGAITRDLAHPFEYKEENKPTMYFVHNGTVTNKKEICEKFGLKYNAFDSDSKIIGQAIYDGANLEELFKFYQGAGVFVWFYEGDDKINLFKGGYDNGKDTTEERPLSVVRDDNGFYFASLDSQLNLISNKEIFTINPNMIITISSKDKDIEDVERKVVDRKVQPIKKEASRSFHSYNYQTEFDYSDTYGDIMSRSDVSNMIWNFNQVVHSHGKYYYNMVLMHGNFFIDDMGQFDWSSDEYWFYKGFLMKNKKSWDNARKRNSVMVDEIHRDVPVEGNSGDIFLNGYRQNNGAVNNIKWSFYNIYVIDGSIRTYTKNYNYRISKQSPYSTPMTERIENYNSYFNTNYTRYVDVEADYRKRFGHRPINGSAFDADFNQLLLAEDDAIYSSGYVDIYNEIAEAECLTIFQCFIDYFGKDKFDPFKLPKKDQEDFFDHLDSYKTKNVITC